MIIDGNLTKIFKEILKKVGPSKTPVSSSTSTTAATNAASSTSSTATTAAAAGTASAATNRNSTTSRAAPMASSSSSSQQGAVRESHELDSSLTESMENDDWAASAEHAVSQNARDYRQGLSQYCLCVLPSRCDTIRFDSVGSARVEGRCRRLSENIWRTESADYVHANRRHFRSQGSQNSYFLCGVQLFV
jgi:hypothetical protein